MPNWAPRDRPDMKWGKQVTEVVVRVLGNLMLFALLMIAFEREVSAYTDPGSGALLWQTLVAALFGAAFYLRKLRRWFGSRKAQKKDDSGCGNNDLGSQTASENKVLPRSGRMADSGER